MVLDGILVDIMLDNGEMRVPNFQNDFKKPVFGLKKRIFSASSHILGPNYTEGGGSPI